MKKFPSDFPLFCLGPLPEGAAHIKLARRIEALPGWQWQEGMRVLTAAGTWLLGPEDCEPGGWAYTAGFPPSPYSEVVVNWLQTCWYRCVAAMPEKDRPASFPSGLEDLTRLEALVADLEAWSCAEQHKHTEHADAAEKSNE